MSAAAASSAPFSSTLSPSHSSQASLSPMPILVSSDSSANITLNIAGILALLNFIQSTNPNDLLLLNLKSRMQRIPSTEGMSTLTWEALSKFMSSSSPPHISGINRDNRPGFSTPPQLTFPMEPPSPVSFSGTPLPPIPRTPINGTGSAVSLAQITGSLPPNEIPTVVYWAGGSSVVLTTVSTILSTLPEPTLPLPSQSPKSSSSAAVLQTSSAPST
jgi:hypothetical protein